MQYIRDVVNHTKTYFFAYLLVDVCVISCEIGHSAGNNPFQHRLCILVLSMGILKLLAGYLLYFADILVKIHIKTISEF